jgi:hypothetical protein
MYQTCKEILPCMLECSFYNMQRLAFLYIFRRMSTCTITFYAIFETFTREHRKVN